MGPSFSESTRSQCSPGGRSGPQMTEQGAGQEYIHLLGTSEKGKCKTPCSKGKEKSVVPSTEI